MITRFSTISLWVGMVLFFMSCGAEQTLRIEKDGSGNTRFDLTLSPVLEGQITELGALWGEEVTEGWLLFDPEALKEEWVPPAGVSLQSLDSPGAGRLQGELRFDSLGALGHGKGDGLFSVSEEGGRTQIRVAVTRPNLEAFFDFLSLDNPLLDAFGPLSTQGMEDNEYLEMLAYALGEEVSGAVGDSFYSLTIEVDGRIISQKGGEQLGPSKVRYRIPLLRLLMVNPPLEYSLLYE